METQARSTARNRPNSIAGRLWYDDDVTSNGDYLTVDMKQLASHRGSLRLGVAAFKLKHEIHTWWLGTRIVTDEDDLVTSCVPRNAPRSPSSGRRPAAVAASARQGNATRRRSDQGESRNMLQKAIDTAGQTTGRRIKPSAILDDPAFKDRRSLSMPESEDVVLSMFLWQS